MWFSAQMKCRPHKLQRDSVWKSVKKNKDFFCTKKLEVFWTTQWFFPFFHAILISNHTCKFLLISKSSCSLVGDFIWSNARVVVSRGFSNPVDPFQPRFSVKKGWNFFRIFLKTLSNIIRMYANWFLFLN